ncbi:MAG: hypothetical protein H7329_05460 [Opitutaceae bacterium]|nr:hypothetical protein [Cytophagales bacterium]
MKQNGINLFLALAVSSVAIFTSCKRSKSEDPAPTPVEEIKKKEVKQSDQTGSSAADDVLEDVNGFINNNVGGGSNKRTEAYNLPCGVVSVDSSTVGTTKTYKMKYGKESKCGYKRKSGLVTFQLINGTRFNEDSSKFKLTFTDYVVEVEATNDIVKLNGYLTSTNTTGGYIWESVTAGKTLSQQIRGSFDVTYSNGVTKNKKYFQTRTWASNNGWAGLSLTVNGDTLSDVSEIGRTLDGDYPYQTHILTPFTWSNCGTGFQGPYVLKVGKARLDAVVPVLSPTYFQIEAGYNNTGTIISPTPVGTCEANTYKITTVLGTTTITQYQLY